VTALLGTGALARTPLGAVFDLSGRPHYVHWHFFEMSVTNLLVIVLMLVVFAAAILLPFPHRRAEP
jgi:hypothetical protein